MGIRRRIIKFLWEISGISESLRFTPTGLKKQQYEAQARGAHGYRLQLGETGSIYYSTPNHQHFHDLQPVLPWFRWIWNRFWWIWIRFWWIRFRFWSHQRGLVLYLHLFRWKSSGLSLHVRCPLHSTPDEVGTRPSFAPV